MNAPQGKVGERLLVVERDRLPGAACLLDSPQQAIEVRGYADFCPLGSNTVPMRSTDSIMWTIKFRNGTMKRFKFPIRTTPEGKAEPSGGFAETADLDGPVLSTEPEALGLPEVWTRK